MSKRNRTADQEAELTYSKAAKAELSRDYDVAFRLYVKSAELYLHLSRTSATSAQVQATKWKASAGKALQRAEKIKAFVDNRKATSTQDIGTNTSEALTELTPVGIDHFSAHTLEEQAFVLRRGASVNGLSFPLWHDPAPKSTSTSYIDSDGQPKLSPEQAEVFPVWRRVPPIRASYVKNPILPQEILQHIVTDCSVCASISVCLEHSRRFGSNLARAAVFCGMTSVSDDELLRTNGRFDIKVLFNGGWRRPIELNDPIVVDDYLPYHPVDGTLMCMSVLPSKCNPGVEPALWPSILEKAYMKLMGGYDFPGSLSVIQIPGSLLPLTASQQFKHRSPV
ncbi:hypothetical protein H0H92_006606 [Tricholoma furcatifolium]|nr:hypothetical protein H0H92_006606 [Tricholoma furcatifolium]